MPFSRILGAGLPALASWSLLAGCYLFDTQVIKPLPSLQGKTTASINVPTALAFRDGKLYVGAANDYRYGLSSPEHVRERAPNTTQGLAIVDTGTGLIESFHLLPRSPSSFAFDSAGRLLIAGAGGERRGKLWSYGVLTLIDLEKDVVYPEVGSLGGGARPLTLASPAGDRIYLEVEDHYDGRFILGLGGDVLKGDTLCELRVTAPSLRSFAASADRLYMWDHTSKRIMVHDALDPYGSRLDSVDILSQLNPGFASAGYMTLRGDRLFVVMLAGTAYSDSAVVAVLHLPTLTVEKTIRLNFHPQGAKVDGGSWYLWHRGLERIDLETRAHGGVLIPEGIVSGGIRDFARVSEHSGYITSTNVNDTPQPLRKVTF